jgi:hypothetical protein
MSLGPLMSRPSHFFDIHSAEELFHLLKAVANSFASSRAKRPQDLLLLVFGLTHLREWIARGYDPKQTAVTPAEHFYQHIFNLGEFKVLQALCNRSKHMSASDHVMGTLHQRTVDDRPDVDSVSDFDRDYATAYSVDERDVEDVIRVVIKFYEDQWFQGSHAREDAA